MEDSEPVARSSKQRWTRTQFWARIFALALLSLVVTIVIYQVGVWQDCGPGRPAGDACNIARGFGLIAAMLAGALIFLLGSIAIGVRHWWRLRSLRKL